MIHGARLPWRMLRSVCWMLLVFFRQPTSVEEETARFLIDVVGGLDCCQDDASGLFGLLEIQVQLVSAGADEALANMHTNVSYASVVNIFGSCWYQRNIVPAAHLYFILLFHFERDCYTFLYQE